MVRMQDLDQVVKQLSTADPIVASCIRKQMNHPDPPRLPEASTPDQYELDLCKMIVYQQISTKAADAIWQRIEPVITHGSADEETLKKHGLSRQKASYIAGIISENRDLSRLTDMSDKDVATELTKYKGIGQWSAEMFLIFSLARPDIFSIGDLGLRSAVSQLYSVDQTNHAEIETITAKWSPHKTIASLCLWHMLDERPLVL